MSQVISHQNYAARNDHGLAISPLERPIDLTEVFCSTAKDRSRCEAYVEQLIANQANLDRKVD